MCEIVHTSERTLFTRSWLRNPDLALDLRGDDACSNTITALSSAAGVREMSWLKSWWPGASRRLKASSSRSKLITVEETEVLRSRSTAIQSKPSHRFRLRLDPARQLN